MDITPNQVRRLIEKCSQFIGSALKGEGPYKIVPKDGSEFVEIVEQVPVSMAAQILAQRGFEVSYGMRLLGCSMGAIPSLGWHNIYAIEGVFGEPMGLRGELGWEAIEAAFRERHQKTSSSFVSKCQPTYPCRAKSAEQIAQGPGLSDQALVHVLPQVGQWWAEIEAEEMERATVAGGVARVGPRI